MEEPGKKRVNGISDVHIADDVGSTANVRAISSDDNICVLVIRKRRRIYCQLTQKHRSAGACDIIYTQRVAIGADKQQCIAHEGTTRRRGWIKVLVDSRARGIGKIDYCQAATRIDHCTSGF